MKNMNDIDKKQYKREFIKMYGPKAWEKRSRERRVIVNMNTGSRTMKSRKDYSRAEGKRICRENLREY